MPARPLTATRRTALVVTAGLAGSAVGGCTSDPPAGPADPPTTSAPPVDADQELVDEVVERLTTVLSAVAAVSGLRSLERLHLAHLDALGVSESAIAYTPLQAASRRELLADEGRLQRFLATAAVRSESGTLAKLLASMSAAVAQHLAVLG